MKNSQLQDILNSPSQREVRQQVRAARERTGRNLGVAVENGRFKVTESFWDQGRDTTLDLSSWGAANDAADFLKAL